MCVCLRPKAIPSHSTPLLSVTVKHVSAKEFSSTYHASKLCGINKHKRKSALVFFFSFLPTTTLLHGVALARHDRSSKSASTATALFLFTVVVCCSEAMSRISGLLRIPYYSFRTTLIYYIARLMTALEIRIITACPILLGNFVSQLLHNNTHTSRWPPLILMLIRPCPFRPSNLQR